LRFIPNDSIVNLLKKLNIFSPIPNLCYLASCCLLFEFTHLFLFHLSFKKEVKERPNIIDQHFSDCGLLESSEECLAWYSVASLFPALWLSEFLPFPC